MISNSLISTTRRSSCNRSSRRRSYLTVFQTVCCICLGFWAEKAVGAEEIILSYGALEFPVSVESLEAYAETGDLNRQLKNYAEFFTSEQLQQFRAGLTTSADFDHLAIAQFLYSYQGEKLLERVSKIIRTKARQPGFYAIRSALILAAADEKSGGLTPLNVLKKFPTDALRIDSRQGFKIIRDLSQVVQTNSQAIAAVQQQSDRERQNLAIDVPNVRDLNLLIPGEYRYGKQRLTLKDSSRNRTFPVDLYLPQLNEERIPLVVISHGLGSDLTTFAYFARHLASHGFAVAVPEHPGSSARQIDALLSGLANNVTPPEELIDRPLDIQFLLDRLAEKYGNKIDTDNVGAIGQSFGAYTTLALAGAELNWDSLERDCPDIDDSWNLSLLIQCLALQIPETDTDIKLKDERVTAAIAINPLASTVFGKDSLSQIDIPIMLVSGSADPVTPALPEQIIPFTWLTTPKKYLVLLEGGTHFSVLNESAGSVPVPEQAIGPDPKLAQDYVKQLGLAFFGFYVTQQSIYADYLNAEYGAIIGRSQIPLNLIESLNPESLQLKSNR